MPSRGSRCDAVEARDARHPSGLLLVFAAYIHGCAQLLYPWVHISSVKHLWDITLMHQCAKRWSYIMCFTRPLLPVPILRDAQLSSDTFCGLCCRKRKVLPSFSPSFLRRTGPLSQLVSPQHKKNLPFTDRLLECLLTGADIGAQSKARNLC